MNMQTAPIWPNAMVLFIVGLAQVPTPARMPATTIDPALGDQTAALPDGPARWVPSEPDNALRKASGRDRTQLRDFSSRVLQHPNRVERGGARGIRGDSPVQLWEPPYLAPAPVSFPSQSDDRFGTGGAESTFPCTTGVASTPCEQYRSLRDLDPEAYAAEYEDCDCDILVVACRLTNTYNDFVTVYDDDGNVVSSETIVSCEYGGCGVEVDLE